MRDPTYHLAHPGYYSIMVVLKDQRLQKVWNKLLLDFVGLNVVKDFEDGLDSLYPHVGFFVIEQLVDLWQVHFLESLRTKQLLMIRLQVFLHELCTLNPNLVVGILAHAENQPHNDGFFVHSLLSNVLCHSGG